MEQKPKKEPLYWTYEDDIALCNWVDSVQKEPDQKYNWKEACALFNDGRTSTQIKLRYKRCLHPSNQKGKWSLKEDINVVNEFANNAPYPNFSLKSKEPRRQRTCRRRRFQTITNFLKKIHPQREVTESLYKDALKKLHKEEYLQMKRDGMFRGEEDDEEEDEDDEEQTPEDKKWRRRCINIVNDVVVQKKEE